MDRDGFIGKHVEDLRNRIYDLHSEHGVGGEAVTCIQCVVSVLNRVEFETVKRFKDRLENEDGS